MFSAGNTQHTDCNINKLNQNDPPTPKTLTYEVVDSVWKATVFSILAHSFTQQMGQDIHINIISCVLTSQWLKENLIEEQNVSRLKCCPFPVAYEFLGFHSRMNALVFLQEGGWQNTLSLLNS